MPKFLMDNHLCFGTNWGKKRGENMDDSKKPWYLPDNVYGVTFKENLKVLKLATLRISKCRYE
jgi:hypothetical protein